MLNPRRLRRFALAVSLVAAAVVAVDPHPFDGPNDVPAMAAASEPMISGTTATTFPTTVTVPVVTADPGTATVPPTISPVVTTPPMPSAPASAATSPPSTSPAAGPPGESTVSAADVPATAPPPATVARFVTPLVPVFAHEGDATAEYGLYNTTEFGTPRVLLTTALRGDWIQVLLPFRPNGSTAWVHASDVKLDAVHDSVDVDLSTRTVTWSRDGRELLQAPAAVGSSATPTPTGEFFVTDVLPWDPSDGRGAWVIALNAHSDAYATFEGGDARIAIHGTNDPSSIGSAVSNGCVRLAAGPLDTLRAGVVPGTPVIVHA